MTDPEILQGDLVEVLADLPADSVDSAVFDPPYGIGYMNRAWDTFAPAAGLARSQPNRAQTANPNVAGRTRAPFASPSSVEYDYSLAGLRAYQEQMRVWGEAIYRVLKPGAHGLMNGACRSYHRAACGLEDAGFEIRDSFAWVFLKGAPKSLNLDQAGGVGTALKPAYEPIALIRKPPTGTTSSTYATYGTGGLNIRDTAIADPTDPVANIYGTGRWPANVVIDGEAEGEMAVICGRPVSRFFFVAKPDRAERELGLETWPVRTNTDMTGGRKAGSAGLQSMRAGAGRVSGSRNPHATVKPIALMQWMIRLVTPPGGTVLDPFLGSGTTACAAMLEDRHCLGIEREPEYILVSLARTEGQRALMEASCA